MTGGQVGLTGATLAGTAVVVLAIWALVWNRRRTETEVLLFGHPAGEIMVSLASLGVIAALALNGVLDARIAGTLLGAHLGYHAAVSGRNRSRPTPSEQPPARAHQRDEPPPTATTQNSTSPPG